MSFLHESLACPNCRGPLSWTAYEGDDGVLHCAACAVRVPVLDGFPLFGERDLDDGAPPAEWLPPLRSRAFGEEAAYTRYLLDRSARGLRDRYAAFRPFNESSRTVLSLLPLLRAHLAPGDLILDTWNRTGWSGDFVAGLFPQQRVISLWEGDCDTLGHRGFARWLRRSQRPANLEVVFVNLDRDPLPFADDSFAFVHGLDTLHRYPAHTLVPELLRVSRADAPLLFPHVHLTNGTPDPFFERGERQLHGTDWDRRLAQALGDDPRRPLVIGERSTFVAQRTDAGPGPLTHAPDTADFNALVGVVPAAWLGQPLAAEPPLPEGEALARCAVIENALLKVDQGDGSVALHDPEQILLRHTVYKERLESRGTEQLSDPLARQLQYWAGRLPTLGSVAARLDSTVDAFRPALTELRRCEFVAVHPVSPGCAALQRYHGLLDAAPTADADTLPALWERAVALFGERPFLHDDADGSSFSYEQADALVQAVAQRLARAGLTRGDQVVIWTALHVEAALSFWAAAHLGLVVIPLDPDLDPATAAKVFPRLKPKLVFSDLGHLAAATQHAPSTPRVVFDAAEGDPSDPFFADWVSDDDFERGPFTPAPELAPEPSIVLFTSGTTGAPRGVVLDQQALAHSGRLVSRTFGLTPDDVYFGLGELHVMSGFRNTVLAVAHAGASAVVASADVRHTPQAVLDCAAAQSATVLGCVPASLRTLTAVAARAPKLRALRLALSTAAPLTPSVRGGFEEAFGVPVLNYYGLTETAGLCAVEPPRAAGDPAPGGMLPVDALFRLVDDDHQDVAAGEVGELWVHSQNLMRGYLDDAERTADAFVGTWFRTRDLARREPCGTYVLVGRARDVFKNPHGELVATAEVEEALRAHPSVRDAGVLVVTDDAGERLDAWVVPHDAAQPADAWLAELHAHLATHLGRKKAPTRLLHSSELLPRNTNGKLIRDRLPREGS